MTSTSTAGVSTYSQAAIEADPVVPLIRITRDFTATVDQLFRAHTVPELFVRWVGPDGVQSRIDYWDARTGGAWRYVSLSAGVEHAFHGSFHTVRPDRIVQTFTWEGMPDDVSLQTLTLADLGGGRARLVAESLVDSFESRDAWLRSGMEAGVRDGYAAIEALVAAGAL